MLKPPPAARTTRASTVIHLGAALTIATIATVTTFFGGRAAADTHRPASEAGGGSAVGATRAPVTESATNPAIGIAPFGPPALSPDLRTRLEEAASAGLLATGASVVTREAVARAAGGLGFPACTDAACLEKLGRATGARLWLRGICVADGSTYRVHLELFDPSATVTSARAATTTSAAPPSPATASGGGTGAVVAARDDTCEICTEAEVAEMTNVAASALRASWKRTASIGAPLPLPLGRGAVPAQAVTSGNRTTRISVTPSPPADQDGTRASTWRRAFPVALMAAGLAGIGGGIYFTHEDGQPADFGTTPAGERYVASFYDTKGLAVASFASAAVLIGAAVVLFAVEGADAAGQQMAAWRAASARAQF